MNNIEEIIELLIKEKPSAEEKNKLEELLKTESQAAEIKELIERLKGIVAQTAHPDLEELSEYALYKVENQTSYKMHAAKVHLIEKHLLNCSRCKTELQTLSEELSVTHKFVREEFSQSKTELTKSSSPSSKFFAFTLRYAAAAAAVLAFVYIALFAISELSIPNSIKLARLDEEPGFYVTRGRLSENFRRGLKAIEEKDYNSAIHFLNVDIDDNRNDETIFYSHYILGLAYLSSAEVSLLGLFPSFDTGKAENAVRSFSEAIEKNQLGKFLNINLDAHFYLGKAYIMLGDYNRAKEHLKQVVELKGSKMRNAESILSKLK